MNNNDNPTSSASQCAQIAAYLKDGNKLTSLDALNLFKCMRLASRIHDLRERGMDIIVDKVQTATGKYVAQYSLNTQA